MLLCTTKNYCVLQNSIPVVSCTTKCDSVLVHYYGSPTNCYSVLQSTTLARHILRCLFLKHEFLSNHCVNTLKKTPPVQHLSTSHRTDHTKKHGNRAFFCYTCCFVYRRWHTPAPGRREAVFRQGGTCRGVSVSQSRFSFVLGRARSYLRSTALYRAQAWRGISCAAET